MNIYKSYHIYRLLYVLYFMLYIIYCVCIVSLLAVSSLLYRTTPADALPGAVPVDSGSLDGNSHRFVCF